VLCDGAGDAQRALQRVRLDAPRARAEGVDVSARCACGAPLPTRADVGAALDSAIDALTRCRLLDGIRDSVDGGHQLALAAYSLLHARLLLRCCETCNGRELRAQAEAVARRILNEQ
jgi:hypothetical protein